MSLHSLAKVLRKHLKGLSDVCKRDYPNYNTLGLLKASEKVEPAKFLPTGGTLLEFYIIAFGIQEDSRIVSRATSERKRDRDGVNPSQELKQYFTDRYAIRFVTTYLSAGP